jgi:hypothetical protein
MSRYLITLPAPLSSGCGTKEAGQILALFDADAAVLGMGAEQ